MGFRSSFTTFGWNVIQIPDWFFEKHGRDFNFMYGFGHFRVLTMPISHKWQTKRSTDDLEQDIQKLLWSEINPKDHMNNPFIMVWLHECGGITRVEFYPDRIVYTEPTGWKEVDASGFNGVPHGDGLECTCEDEIKSRNKS